MLKDFFGPVSDFVFAIGCRQAGLIAVQEIEDCRPHRVAGTFFIPPLVHSEPFVLERRKQLDRDLLDLTDLLGTEFGLHQQVVKRQALLVESLPDRALLFFVQFIHEAQQFLEGLFNRDAVFPDRQ